MRQHTRARLLAGRGREGHSVKHRIGFLVAFTILAVSFAAIPTGNRLATAAEGANQVTRVEQITGPTAAAYLKAKLAKDAAIWNAYETSAAHLRARGFKQTNEVVVVRRYRAPVNAGRTSSPFQELLRRFVPSLQAQVVSASSSEGEVIYTSWDDGNDESWEGEQFFQDYSDGYWELTQLQEQIVEDPVVMWATLVGSRDGRERIERGGLLPNSLAPSEELRAQPVGCRPSLQTGSCYR